jgi:glycosyltransferase involved in cell wall biosynthesis
MALTTRAVMVATTRRTDRFAMIAGAKARPDWLWVDWDRHLRTRSLCERMGIELLEIAIPGPRLPRYLKSTVRTLRAIRARRPKVVIATNPSIVLGFLLLLAARWYRFALVADAHYLGVQSPPGAAFLQRALDFYNRRVSLVIVTNEVQATKLRTQGAWSFVCPDPLPRLPEPIAASAVTVPAKSVFLICSFDADEPWAQVFAAFGELAARGGFTLFVSGNFRKANLNPSGLPGVHLLGFVPEADYYGYLRACDLVIDLTTLEDCLVCGAYEAIAAGKPLITSGSAALRSYFAEAAVYTAHDPLSIARCVEQAFAERQLLTDRVLGWRTRNQHYLDERLVDLRVELEQLGRQVCSSRPD